MNQNIKIFLFNLVITFFPHKINNSRNEDEQIICYYFKVMLDKYCNENLFFNLEYVIDNSKIKLSFYLLLNIYILIVSKNDN
jgi:hypothetical protein